MRILFQGDSVTDAGRDYANPLDLGPGYVATTVRCLREALPDAEFTFLNRGIGGNRTSQLAERLQRDFLDLQPDLVTILIGVNDSWHRCPPTCIDTTNEQFELNYRTVLDALRAQHIAIVMLEPFSLPSDQIPDFRADLASKIEIVRRLAAEYACAYLPLDGLAAAEAIRNGVGSLTDDGVHPNASGRIWLGTQLANLLIPILRERMGLSLV